MVPPEIGVATLLRNELAAGLELMSEKQLNRSYATAAQTIDGVAYPLEAMQVNILLALMDDFDHRMEGRALRDACGSSARNFRPVKQFDRNKIVYETFIRYVPGDKEYELIICAGDSDWLTLRR